MGGPNKPSEVKMFLKNMFNDPYILPVKNGFLRSLLAWLISSLRHKNAKANYAAIGGKSPIAGITASLCQRLAQLQEKTQEMSFHAIDFAMRYTPPFASDVLKKYKDYDEIVLFPLYPHHSNTTIASSLDDAVGELKKLDFKGRVRIVREFYESKEYNEVLIKSLIASTAGENLKEYALIISAHSLPQKLIANGDKYETHINAHIKILKSELKQNGVEFKDVVLAYQSRLGPVKWLEPELGKAMSRLSQSWGETGVKAVVLPISFCIDNSESVFELGIEFAKHAKELGYSAYSLLPCPNDSDEFAKFILNTAAKYI